MHKLTYTLVAGVFFWVGIAIGEASKPVERFKRVTPPEKLTPALQPICENLVEIRRTCVARKRSEAIRQVRRP